MSRRAAIRAGMGRINRDKLVSALEATASYRRMVLLGDPGSGKSTFITNFTLALALHGLDPAHGWVDRLRGWPRARPRYCP